MKNQTEKLKVIKKDDKQKRKHYNFLCRQIKRSAKTNKEEYINKICEDIESKRKQNNSRAVYEGIRKITGTRAPRINIVKYRNWLILKGDDEVKSRWKEYFEELYKDPNTVDRTDLSEIPITREEDKEETSCWISQGSNRQNEEEQISKNTQYHGRGNSSSS